LDAKNRDTIRWWGIESRAVVMRALLNLTLAGDRTGGLLAPCSRMKFSTRQQASPYATETVWDGGLSGTGLSAEGRELNVGRGDGGWSPEHLLLLGAESSLMESFLAAAHKADIRVLGYVSSGHLEIPDEAGAAPRLTLKPCVVVATLDEAQRAARLSTAVAHASIAGRLLGDRLHVGLDIRLEPSA
jgi:hypothetical protein